MQLSLVGGTTSAALEEEVERLRESSAALNRRFFEAVAKADGAEAARQEEAEKCRREMESALAEVRERAKERSEKVICFTW